LQLWARGASGKTQTYTVKIPKGVREGQRIRLAGLGEEGGGGDHAGDLYLRIKLEKHPDFEVQDSDLFYDLEVPAWQAVLGGDVEIPTLDGRAKLHLPPGAQNGQKFRLTGRGLAQKGGGRGNFYAVLRPTLPRDISQRERELWQESPPWSKNIIAEVLAAFRRNHFRKAGLVVAMFHRRWFVAGGDAAATMPLYSKNDSSWRLAGFPW
jgi:DnaJ-class molecular chaperone